MAERKKFILSDIIKKDLKGWERQKKVIPPLLANEMVNDFTQNFTRQGFRNVNTKKWKARKGNTDPGRGILIGKGSGNKLFRSIKAIKVNSNRVLVGSSVHYAGVHNYGLRAGRGKGFQMPKRQFIGYSKTLRDNLIKLILKRIDKGFNK
ncbi:MAG: phage virion morphogenesis protein [Deltaproteobacteria bacterium]|nr:phage virion morphogenesis protein [Deltaproteobacteria bacterium]